MDLRGTSCREWLGWTVAGVVFGVVSYSVLFTTAKAIEMVSSSAATAEVPVVSPARPRPALAYIGHVFNVVDGDTIDVEVSYSFRVRLLDCWAPEKHGESKAEGMASMRNLVRLAAGKDCVVEIPMGTDVKKSLSFDRVLGRVWINGQDSDLSSQQVQGGFATRKKDQE